MKNITTYVIGILFGLSLASCTTHYFGQPQPVDEQNAYRFPKKFQGLWGDAESSGIAIGVDYFTVDEQQVDTVSSSDFKQNYITNKGKAYRIPKDSTQGSFEVGKYYEALNGNYLIKDDPEVLKVHLGPNNFLRDCGPGYLLNMQEDNGWYTLAYMRHFKRGKMEVSLVTVSDAMIEQLKQSGDYIGTHNKNHYFNVAWTSQQWEQRLAKGDMVVTVDTLTRISKKINK